MIEIPEALRELGRVFDYRLYDQPVPTAMGPRSMLADGRSDLMEGTCGFERIAVGPEWARIRHHPDWEVRTHKDGDEDGWHTQLRRRLQNLAPEEAKLLQSYL